ncbi:MAG: hypothetical protein WCQ67_05415 [Treponema sp.]
MEVLESELDNLIEKLKDKVTFKNQLESLNSIYPFSKYEYIISKLLSEKILSYEEYIDLRDEYIERNLFLYVFELTGPRSFGDTWAFSHLKTIEPSLEQATRKREPSYQGEYDMLLPYNGESIKIEVKASRAVDRDKNDMPLYQKALSSSSKANFLMNFQQIKPSCCDVFVWLAVYRDKIRYWVMKNTVVANNPDFCPQHRNEETASREKNYDKASIFEGQIMIHNSNIDTISPYEVDSRQLRQAIIEQYES